jgi:heme A synthase
MNTSTFAADSRDANALHVLARCGEIGAVLVAVVLSASVALRLTAVAGPDGAMVPSLPEAVEAGVRLAHRIAAMGVTVLALLVAWVAWSRRAIDMRGLAPAVTIVLLTVLLALLGRWTAGYRHPEVTVGNVAGGVALVGAFWALREAVRGAARRLASVPAALARFAALAVIAQAGLGAATSALRSSIELLGPVHVATALLVAAQVAIAAWPQRRAGNAAGPAQLLLGLTALQLALGALSLAPERATLLVWLHTMVAAVMVSACFALASRLERNGVRLH